MSELSQKQLEVAERYRSEPWGRFLYEDCGIEPWDAEPQARYVAERAAERIAELKKVLCYAENMILELAPGQPDRSVLMPIWKALQEDVG